MTLLSNQNKKMLKFVFLLLIFFVFLILCNYYLESSSIEERYDSIIVKTAERHSVSWQMIKAIIRQESHFHANAKGGVGEIGLMQITIGAARDWEKKKHTRKHTRYELFNPELNLEIGTWYYARALKQWKKKKFSEIYALAQYNAGRKNLLRWTKNMKHDTNPIKKIGFPSTRNYVKRVMNFYHSYLKKQPNI
ncbi:MAG: transglycosylase SLT domain-containing protein [Verrucomicrobiota bacterium]|nr:transglycosylase SLT domain-containing protein [Verrucomicrobiota bacterium]